VPPSHHIRWVQRTATLQSNLVDGLGRLKPKLSLLSCISSVICRALLSGGFSGRIGLSLVPLLRSVISCRTGPANPAHQNFIKWSDDSFHFKQVCTQINEYWEKVVTKCSNLKICQLELQSKGVIVEAHNHHFVGLKWEVLADEAREGIQNPSSSDSPWDRDRDLHLSTMFPRK
jgi:hypothetical protein